MGINIDNAFKHIVTLASHASETLVDDSNPLHAFIAKQSSLVFAKRFADFFMQDYPYDESVFAHTLQSAIDQARDDALHLHVYQWDLDKFVAHVLNNGTVETQTYVSNPTAMTTANLKNLISTSLTNHPCGTYFSEMDKIFNDLVQLVVEQRQKLGTPRYLLEPLTNTRLETSFPSLAQWVRTLPRPQDFLKNINNIVEGVKYEWERVYPQLLRKIVDETRTTEDKTRTQRIRDDLTHLFLNTDSGFINTYFDAVAQDIVGRASRMMETIHTQFSHSVAVETIPIAAIGERVEDRRSKHEKSPARSAPL